MRLRNPIEVIEAWEPDAVRPAIARAEMLAIHAGLRAAGFVAYEAGAAFGLAGCTPQPRMPLAWFGMFESDDVEPVNVLPESGSYDLDALRPSLDQRRFEEAFERIRHHIVEGDTYQVNFTFRMLAAFRGDPAALFADLVAAQNGGYAAYLDIGHHAICSASPELFFERTGNRLECRPMKGTARRGRTLAEDREQADALRRSAKQRSENVMIVDMVRNDLGRIAKVGSVDVQQLFAVERYPTLWQMTSRVTATADAPLDEVFAALHPSASVTGAPKVRTAEIIRELEGRPRGVYTGAIGQIEPGGDARFNVAIRTAVVDLSAGRVELGSGSGIVWESDARGEYEECLLKGGVLGRRPVRFELLETLRWSREEGFFLLDRHLARLRDSAEYFGFVCRMELVREALENTVRAARAESLRLRLLTAADGQVRIESAPLVRSAPLLQVALARAPISAGDVFLFHKTTNRHAYDSARIPGCDDVIMWNARGEITEATTANIVVERGGRRVTPPVGCGLLAGTFRAELLARGDVTESIVRVDELLAARVVWLVNSVHEWRQAAVSRVATETIA